MHTSYRNPQEAKIVFRLRLGKSPPADVPPMRVRIEPGKRAIRVKARQYPPDQRQFLDKYVDTLRSMECFVDMPTAEWQAAPLLVPKRYSRAKYRMAVDLRPVNAATSKVSWPMCGRRYLEPTTSVATKVGTGRPSGYPRPPGDGGDSCRRRLGYEEPDAGQA